MSLLGFKFRRQVRLGPYIVDFCCFQRKLIIELDGGHHKGDKRTQDLIRDRYFEDQGYTVIRIWNSELVNEKKVLEKIRDELI
jgi:very-short-patch-repair endonuclease